MHGKFLSEPTAEYPSSLAAALAELMRPFVTSTSRQNFALSDFANLLTEDFVPRRMKIVDGAGMNSTADHTAPQRHKPHPLASAWLKWFEDNHATSEILQRLMSGKPEHPLNQTQKLALADIARAHVCPSLEAEHCVSIPGGQPSRQHLLHALAEHFQDPDAALPSLRIEGVPTGIFDELPTSNQWQQRPRDMANDPLDNVQLSHCTGNWARAKRDPALLKTLLQKEIDAGHVKAFPGNRQDAEERWPQRTAVGKLNIVIADNRDPRLVLDSTICNANTLCRVPEHVTLPSAQEVLRSFQSGDKYGAWLGIALDFKAAHKAVKIREDEQGTVLFEVDDKLYHYTVCHFGAKFSAYYWWARVGGLIHRIFHRIAGHVRHRSWLYVDPARTPSRVSLHHHCTAGKHQCSYKLEESTGRRPDHLVRMEFQLCGAHKTIHLASTKLAKLREQLQQLLHGKELLRKRLEAALGLLMWATCTCKHLRPYMAPLYRDLHSAAGTLKLIHPQFWQPFLDSLVASAKIIAQPPGLWLPFQSGVQQLPQRKPAQGASSAQRHLGPHCTSSRTEVHLTAESKSAVKWLQQCFGHDRLRPLQQAPLLACFAAADAMADEKQVGIGAG